MIKPILKIFKKENINNIKIKKEFLDSPPKREKMIQKWNIYTATGKFKDEIVIDNNNYLIDGYTTYLMCKTLNKKIVKVRRVNNSL